MKLSEIREACEAATPGPWHPEARTNPDRIVCSMLEGERTEEEAMTDAVFVCVARAALPALLQVIDHYQHTDDSKDFNAAMRDAGIEVDS